MTCRISDFKPSILIGHITFLFINKGSLSACFYYMHTALMSSALRLEQLWNVCFWTFLFLDIWKCSLLSALNADKKMIWCNKGNKQINKKYLKWQVSGSLLMFHVSSFVAQLCTSQKKKHQIPLPNLAPRCSYFGSFFIPSQAGYDESLQCKNMHMFCTHRAEATLFRCGITKYLIPW